MGSGSLAVHFWKRGAQNAMCKARTWFEAAAAQGARRAEYFLGVCVSTAWVALRRIFRPRHIVQRGVVKGDQMRSTTWL